MSESELRSCELCKERPRIPGFIGCDECIPDRHECQIHKCFGIGPCSYCLGMKLFEVRIFWNVDNLSSERCKQVQARNWARALAAVQSNEKEDDNTITSVSVRLLETPEQREMVVKWSKWEQK